MKIGLLESDDECNQCISEAVVSFMRKQLRSLFVTILIFGKPGKPDVLWKKFKEAMGEDILRHVSFSLQPSTRDSARSVENGSTFAAVRRTERNGNLP